jgi:hypothetical protein
MYNTLAESEASLEAELMSARSHIEKIEVRRFFRHPVFFYFSSQV